MSVVNRNRRFILGTRGSGLALAQTGHVRTLLENRHPGIQFEIKVIRTEGDIDRTSPLSSFGGRGAFVRTIETALIDTTIDAGVHSLKDLPSRLPEGLTLGSVPEREDPRDVLVTNTGESFPGLPPGGTIATGSDRRRIQAAALRPDLTFVPIRGNIETRIGRVGKDGIDGVMLAAAGLRRLGRGSRITQLFEPEEILPAPCQGALGIECREDDSRVIELVRAIENPEARICADVERAFIAALGFGCHAPVAALAVIENDMVRLDVFAASDTGKLVRHRNASPPERARAMAETLAVTVKQELSMRDTGTFSV